MAAWRDARRREAKLAWEDVNVVVSITEISSRRRVLPDMREAWRHRRLAVMLMQRNIKVRYRQTVLGSLWVVLQPLLLTGVLTVVLGMILQIPSGDLPYVLFALSGTTIWSAFQRALNDTGISLASSGAIILKVYFPRILVPISAALTAIVDIVPILVVLLVMSIAYGLFPGWPILVAPVFVLLALVLAFATGLLVTVLDAVFRDMRLIIPSALQLVLYVSPVMYSETSVPERWWTLYELNPLVAIIQGFRWSTLAGAPPPDLFGVAWACGFAGVTLIAGLTLFARLENFAVDRI
jgi:lipopolysaccharide transport system permease protein